jgi:hypothetical protein
MGIALEFYKIASAVDAPNALRGLVLGGLGGMAAGGLMGGIAGLAHETMSDDSDYRGALARGVLGGAIAGGVTGAGRGLLTEGVQKIPGDRVLLITGPNQVHSSVRPDSLRSIHGENALSGAIPGALLGTQYASAKKRKSTKDNETL